jgi:acetoin utilization protein AcuB
VIAVENIMTPDPITAQPLTTLEAILQMMKSNACRQIVVTDQGKVVGIVTDRDTRLAMNSPFVMHERAQDRALLSSVTAEACMTRDPLTIEASAPATEAARLLKTHKFGSLPVVRDGQLVGIVTVSDILNSYIGLLESAETPT